MDSIRSPALIGTVFWHPLGESMPTVLKKIALRNQHNTNELRRLTGPVYETSFSIDPHRRYSVRSVHDYERLGDLAGWPTNALEPSFPSFYRLPDTLSSVSDNKFFDGHWRWRMCRVCAMSGEHLLLHQSRAFAHCPIHDEPLTSRCPGCNEDFVAFGFPLYAKQSFWCRQCGWSLLQHAMHVDKLQQQRRLRLFEELSSYTDEIERAATGTHPVARLLEQPRRLGDLRKILALVPGPTWMSTSLAHANRVRVQTFAVSGDKRDAERVVQARSKPSPALTSECVLGSEVVLGEIEQDVVRIVVGLQVELSRRYNRHGDRSGVYLAKNGYVRSYFEYATSASVALHWWKDCLAVWLDIFDCDARVRSAAYRTHARIWFDFTTSCGRLLLTNDNRPRRCRRVDKLVRTVGARRARYFFELLFLGLLARASLEAYSVIDPDDLLDIAYDCNATPVTALIVKRNGIRYATVSDFAPQKKVYELFASGYEGFPTSRTHTSSSPDPLRMLLAIGDDVLQWQ